MPEKTARAQLAEALEEIDSPVAAVVQKVVITNIVFFENGKTLKISHAAYKPIPLEEEN